MVRYHVALATGYHYLMRLMLEHVALATGYSMRLMLDSIAKL